MKAAASAFVDFLVADMEATESTEFALSLLAQAKAKITAGAGDLAFVTSGEINGQSFARTKELSSMEMALAIRTAIDRYEGTAGSGCITFLDFSGA